MATDMVHHPPHYTSHPAGIECIDVIEPFPYNVGAAIKYLWRAGLKGAAIEDLLKAHFYVVREIGRLQRQATEAELSGELKAALARFQSIVASQPPAADKSAAAGEQTEAEQRGKRWPR